MRDDSSLRDAPAAELGGARPPSNLGCHAANEEGTLRFMQTPADALRRWLGLFCLTMAGGMLIWGQTVLKPHLEGFGFLSYWAGCSAAGARRAGILDQANAGQTRTRGGILAGPTRSETRTLGHQVCAKPG